MLEVVEKAVVGFGSRHINRFSGKVRRVRREAKTECWNHRHLKGWQRK